jgi:hypothetical protein
LGIARGYTRESWIAQDRRPISDALHLRPASHRPICIFISVATRGNWSLPDRTSFTRAGTLASDRMAGGLPVGRLVAALASSLRG